MPLNDGEPRVYRQLRHDELSVEQTVLLAHEIMGTSNLLRVNPDDKPLTAVEIESLTASIR